MDSKSPEDCSLRCLKAELIQVTNKQSEIAHHEASISLKLRQKKVKALASQLQSTKQRIEFYTFEFQRALEGMKDSNWRITKELCKDLIKLQSPPKTLSDTCEKLMMILKQPDPSFTEFKKLIKNFEYFKDLMGSMQGAVLSENVIHEILPIWKNQSIIQAKLSKFSKCACLIAEWISYIVEFSLKKNTVAAGKLKEPELEKKLAKQSGIVNSLAQEIKKIQEKIENTKKVIQCKIEIDDLEFAEHLSLFPQGGIKSYKTVCQKSSFVEEISQIKEGFTRSEAFPNFAEDELYKEISIAEESDHQIEIEGKYEAIGCCRMKFFCF